MKILFSPIGMTDPVNDSNLEEGSLLQICRKIEPDKIYLFYSKEVLELHDYDNRYILSLEELYKSFGKDLDYEIISRPNLIEVQIFDYFYKEFRDILDNIHNNHDKDEIYLNISSGTPAMKNALFILSAISDYKMFPVQVDTPMKSSNIKTKEYDLVSHLELIRESNGNKNFINRAHIAKMDNLNYEIKKEIMFNHLTKFDYSAALDVAETIVEFLPNKTFLLVNAAFHRSRLDLFIMRRFLERAGESFFMYDGTKYDTIEYLLYLDVLIRRNLLLEFIRGITPAIYYIFRLIIEIENDIDLSKYILMRENDAEFWNIEALNSEKYGKKILNTLDKGYRDGFNKDGFVKSDHFVKLIKDEYYCKNEKIVKIVENLRKVESDLRNKAAHQIISINEKKIKNQTGYSPEEIFGMIKEIIKYLKFDVSKNHWDSYMLMNQKIISSAYEIDIL